MKVMEPYFSQGIFKCQVCDTHGNLPRVGTDSKLERRLRCSKYEFDSVNSFTSDIGRVNRNSNDSLGCLKYIGVLRSTVDPNSNLLTCYKVWDQEWTQLD